MGGAMAGVAAMSMYHRYRMYQSMLYYGGYGGYGYGHGGYGYGGYGHRGMLYNEFDCVGGCPMQAFCDYGVCRCRSGYDARYGKCWKDINDFNNNNWNERKGPGFNPHKSCSDHDVCKEVDMNMECDQGTCQCRDEMKWNEEALECQIYMDVNCTDVDTESIIEEKKNETTYKYDDTEIFNSTDSTGKVNVSEITAEETLANSELAELNPNTTSKEDMRKAFCRDVARVARSYESNLVVPVKENYYNSSRGSGGGYSWVKTVLGIVAAIAIAYIALTIYKKKCRGSRSRSRSRSNSKSEDDNAGPPPTEMYATQPPMAQPAYPPAYPPVQDPGLPPPGPAIPPTQPGYPAIPDPNTDGAPPYPPAGGAAPYPPAPVGGAAPPYPPQPAGGAAPYPPAPVGPPPYEAQAPYPAYPPQAPAGVAPPYPQQPPYNPNP